MTYRMSLSAAVLLAMTLAASAHAGVMTMLPSEWTLSVGATSQTYTDPITLGPPAVVSELTTTEGRARALIYRYDSLGSEYLQVLSGRMLSVGGVESVSEGSVNFNLAEPRLVTPWGEIREIGNSNDPGDISVHFELDGRQWNPSPHPLHPDLTNWTGFVAPIAAGDHTLSWRVAYTGPATPIASITFVLRVPEPATGLAVAAVGLCGVVAWRRRR